MEWLRNNRGNEKDEGIIYFADDDNTYSVDLFNEVSKHFNICIYNYVNLFQFVLLNRCEK